MTEPKGISGKYGAVGKGERDLLVGPLDFKKLVFIRDQGRSAYLIDPDLPKPPRREGEEVLIMDHVLARAYYDPVVADDAAGTVEDEFLYEDVFIGADYHIQIARRNAQGAYEHIRTDSYNDPFVWLWQMDEMGPMHLWYVYECDEEIPIIRPKEGRKIRVIRSAADAEHGDKRN
jgi:hypothetical protein